MRNSINKSQSFDVEAYEFYISHADKHERTLDAFKSAVASATGTFKELQEGSRKWTLLDVGSGPGQLTTSLLKFFLSHRKNLEAYLIEPEHYIMKDLKRRVDSVKLKESADIYYFEENLEGFLLQSRNLKESFDFILCSHVFYYVEDWERSVEQLMGLLKEDGLICIILASSDTDLYRFMDNVVHLLKAPPWVSLRLGEHLKEMLELKRIKFMHESVASRICFSAQELKNLLNGKNIDGAGDPFTKVNSFLFGYPPEAFENEALDLERKFIKGYLTGQNGAVLPYKDDVFWIEKQQNNLRKEG